MESASRERVQEVCTSENHDPSHRSYHSCICIDCVNYGQQTASQTLSVPNGYEFLNEWHPNLSANGQFRNPQDVAVDSADNVYVADAGNNRVQKFDSNGILLQNGVPWVLVVDDSMVQLMSL